jgi:hypothetical protein|tara:strand:- start:2303 stop:2764 length:462 start_codon:yes stop_codon:yes gene_type:complete
MTDFDTSLKAGQLVENLFLTRLKNKYPKSVLIVGSFKDFDIYVPEIDIKYEVKSDIKSNHTGNYLIEVEHYGKPSALLTTKADYWIFYDENDWVCTKPSKIKDLILLRGYRQVKTTGSGDTHHKLCYLIKKEHIKTISKIFPCSDWEKINKEF